MKTDPIPRQSLADAVFDQISQQIVDGDVAPGSALPTERDLAQAFRVSRGSIREALQRLAQIGLVAIRHGGGIRVLDAQRTGGLDLLPQYLFRADGTLNVQAVRSVMEMRAALAPDVARLAARRAPPEIVQALADGVTAMASAADNPARLQLLALEFWDALVRGSDNLAYELAFNSLRTPYERLLAVLVPALDSELREHTAYTAIARAVAARDETAARDAAAALMQLGTRGMLEILEPLGP